MRTYLREHFALLFYHKYSEIAYSFSVFLWFLHGHTAADPSSLLYHGGVLQCILGFPNPVGQVVKETCFIETIHFNGEAMELH